jgi:RHS repeat-associated protein
MYQLRSNCQLPTAYCYCPRFPFGMGHLGPWYESVSPENKYLSPAPRGWPLGRGWGKELNDEEGVGLYDYGARWYDAALGRWGQVDPLAEPQASWSTYHYVYGNPMKYFDPFGLMGADGLTNQQWMKASRPGGSAGAARRYREDNRQAEAEQARFGKWFRENYEWNPHAGQEVGRATLGGALRLSFSGGYLLRQTASGQSFRFSEAPSPHAISVSAGAAWGGGIGFEVGKVYDGRGRSAWFFRADARIGVGGGLSVNYEEIVPAPGVDFEVGTWGGYDNYWSLGLGPLAYGEGENQEVWGRDGDRWFNPAAMSGQSFTYQGGSIQPPSIKSPRKHGPVTRNPKGWGLTFEAYKSWGKTYLRGLK